MPHSAKKPTIFISYSHLDEPDPLLEPDQERWLTYVSSYLQPAAINGDMDLWDDRRIEAGGKWRDNIDDALSQCAVCVFLVSVNWLSSKFIRDVEVKKMLERYHAEGAHIYPIVISSIDIDAVPWLKELNLKPVNGTALELYKKPQRNQKMAQLAAEIRTILQSRSSTARDENNVEKPPARSLCAEFGFRGHSRQ